MLKKSTMFLNDKIEELGSLNLETLISVGTTLQTEEKVKDFQTKEETFKGQNDDQYHIKLYNNIK